MRPEPFIGISGFLSREEIEIAIAQRPKQCALVMFAAPVSSLALEDKMPIQPKRFVSKQALPTLFSGKSGLLNLITLTIDEEHENETEHLTETMLEAKELAGHNCHGFHLKVVWPSVKAIESYKREHPLDTIMVECGLNAIKSVEGSPVELRQHLKMYGDLINYVIVEHSGEERVPFNHIAVKDYVLSLRELDYLGFVFAGNLSANNLHRVYPLLKLLPEFSIVAQTKLRPNDHLNADGVAGYLSLGNAMRNQYGRIAA